MFLHLSVILLTGGCAWAVGCGWGPCVVGGMHGRGGVHFKEGACVAKVAYPEKKIE